MSYSVLPDGFIRHYLYTGRKESEFSCDVQETNQLRSEKKMRELAARHDPLTPPADLRLGGESPLGLPWKYYYSHGNIFLDDPAFYEELCRVEMHAATGLELAAPARISLRLWSYAAVDLWVDGAPACTLEHPVYKPIQYRDFTLDLSAGQHLLYLRLENLGVRDTRIAFAVQITQGADLVRVTLPDADHCAPYEAAAALLDSARVQGGRLTLRAPLPAGSRLRYDRGIGDFRRQKERFLLRDAAGCTELPLEDYVAFPLEIPVGDTVLSRPLERAELRRPVYLAPDVTDHRRYQLEQIAAIASETRSATDGFALFPMLARKYLGMNPDSDHEELRTTLRQIERRMDCADFMTTALIRLQREYGIPADLEEEMKRVLLNFRYWMDEPGQDGMCFWSENHTLMFFETAYFFGGLYPDEVFVRSGRTAARHCFRGILAAPMGRVYRGIIAPWEESMQAMLNWLFPAAPYATCPSLSFWATTRYTPPADLEEIAAGTGAFHYTTSNARIDGYKTGDYLLTSVQSPRRDGVQRVWQPEEREEMRDHFIYVKSLNEHFHGTTQFQPGEYGYQQHMWYAALSDDLVVFANHPGHTCEDMSEVRPGYWYGNGAMPALRQQDNVLGAVYVIPQSNPIAFTHLFWQQDRFDETAARGGWIFGRRGNSCIGVWCSVPLVDHDETMFGCEKRAMAPASAYLVVCGSTAESGSFDAFCQSCLDRPVAFDPHTATLHCAEFDLPFTAGSNGTQILD